MALPLNLIIPGISAVKDIITSIGSKKSSDEKLKKVEDFIREQDKINAYNIEAKKQQDNYINGLSQKVSSLQKAIVILIIAEVATVLELFLK